MKNIQPEVIVYWAGTELSCRVMLRLSDSSRGIYNAVSSVLLAFVNMNQIVLPNAPTPRFLFSACLTWCREL